MTRCRLTKPWSQEHPKRRQDGSIEIAGPEGLSSGEGFARVSRPFGHSPSG